MFRVRLRCPRILRLTDMLPPLNTTGQGLRRLTATTLPISFCIPLDYSPAELLLTRIYQIQSPLLTIYPLQEEHLPATLSEQTHPSRSVSSQLKLLHLNILVHC